jgi:hypothetical protein
VQVNHALQFNWSDADTKQYAGVVEVWNQGFRPSTQDPRFAKGMEARWVQQQQQTALNIALYQKQQQQLTAAGQGWQPCSGCLLVLCGATVLQMLSSGTAVASVSSCACMLPINMNMLGSNVPAMLDSMCDHTADFNHVAGHCNIYSCYKAVCHPLVLHTTLCRLELVARFRRAMNDPQLLPGSIPAVLRDEYGADSAVITDNLIMLLFAGFETSTSLAVRLLYELARHPDALKKVRCGSLPTRCCSALQCYTGSASLACAAAARASQS